MRGGSILIFTVKSQFAGNKDYGGLVSTVPPQELEEDGSVSVVSGRYARVDAYGLRRVRQRAARMKELGRQEWGSGVVAVGPSVFRGRLGEETEAEVRRYPLKEEGRGMLFSELFATFVSYISGPVLEAPAKSRSVSVTGRKSAAPSRTGGFSQKCLRSFMHPTSF